MAQFLKRIPDLKQVLLVGGSTVKEDIAQMQNGTNIIVATPGRLEDILSNHREIQLAAAVKSLVTIQVSNYMHTFYIAIVLVNNEDYFFRNYLS